MHRQQRVALINWQQRVAEVDVRFGHHQVIQALQQIGSGFFEFDDEQLAHGVRNAFFEKQLLRGFWVADDQPSDRGIARVLHAEADDFDVATAQHFDQCCQSSHAILEHHGKLLDRRTVADGVCCHPARVYHEAS